MLSIIDLILKMTIVKYLLSCSVIALSNYVAPCDGLTVSHLRNMKDMRVGLMTKLEQASFSLLPKRAALGFRETRIEWNLFHASSIRGNVEESLACSLLGYPNRRFLCHRGLLLPV